MSIVPKKWRETIKNSWYFNVSTFVMYRGVTRDVTGPWPSQGLFTPTLCYLPFSLCNRSSLSIYSRLFSWSFSSHHSLLVFLLYQFIYLFFSFHTFVCFSSLPHLPMFSDFFISFSLPSLSSNVLISFVCFSLSSNGLKLIISIYFYSFENSHMPSKIQQLSYCFDGMQL